MKIAVGDLYWAITEGEISHPHVIIQNDESKGTLVVCSLTTNMKKLSMPGNVLLDLGEGNLEKQSIIEVGKEFTINKSQLKEYIGSLSLQRVEEVLSGIGFLRRTYFPTPFKE